MRLQTLILICLVPVVLTFSLLFAHVLEIPGKLPLDGPGWLTVQQHLYVAFAPAGAIGEIAAILLSWFLFFRLRRSPGRSPAAIAALCLTAALVLWFIIVAPVNGRLNGWTAASLPADWQDVRNRWEAGHAVAALLYGVAIALLTRLLIRARDRVAPPAAAP